MCRRSLPTRSRGRTRIKACTSSCSPAPGAPSAPATTSPPTRTNEGVQAMPWDPMKDYAFMMRNTELFMSLWRSYRPVICKVHGFAVAGGSDIALCSDIILMEETAEIGYMPVRVWGCPTTAMWVYRLGPERAKRMLFTGDLITGDEAAAMGLVLEAVDPDRLDARVEELALRMAGVPRNQLMMQKLMIN